MSLEPASYLLTDIRYEEILPERLEDPKAAARKRPLGLQGAEEREAELWIVTGGSGTLEFAGRSCRLERGRLLLGALGGQQPRLSAQPGAAVKAPEASAPLTLYRLGFRAADACGAPLVGEAALPVVGAVDDAPFALCEQRAQVLYERRAESGAVAVLERQIAFQELLLAALRQREGRTPAGTASRANSREAVQRSVERIRREYREPLTVEALAASAGMGRWAYTRLFKELTDRLPLDFLNEVRIGQAKRLLLDTEERLGEIAQRIGFSSEYYFSRRFKRETGLSPGHYRRLHRREVRVFAPYLEDALLTIGIMPIAQYSHRAWGVQDYLPLGEVPAFDVADGTREDLSRLKPELLLFDDGFERWSLDRLSGVAPWLLLEQPSETGADRLRRTAALFGREAAAEEALRGYREETREARASLAAIPGGSPARGSVACLRITARHVLLYAERFGYTGPVLYDALGLEPPALVRQLPEGQRQIMLRPEELSRLQADHLFVVFDKSENHTPGEERSLLQHPCWLALPAVRAGRVYEMDFFAWMNAGLLAHTRKVQDVKRVLQ
ncbi:hypothetical protein B9G55_14475 [Saccharibacillus sp. O16]|nr:hypothetical protein B9G55_14475 [Saccharibacillus sp. O16]